jgi:hypothetical protein
MIKYSDYCVLRCVRYDILQKQVNERLKNGWYLHGNIAIHAHYKNETIYVQCMVKP